MLPNLECTRAAGTFLIATNTYYEFIMAEIDELLQKKIFPNPNYIFVKCIPMTHFLRKDETSFGITTTKLSLRNFQRIKATIQTQLG